MARTSLIHSQLKMNFMMSTKGSQRDKIPSILSFSMPLQQIAEPTLNKFQTKRDLTYIEGNITQGELDLAVSKIRSEAAPGVDGISGSLLRYLYSKFPKFFLKATNEEILKGKCHDKEKINLH